MSSLHELRMTIAFLEKAIEHLGKTLNLLRSRPVERTTNSKAKLRIFMTTSDFGACIFNYTIEPSDEYDFALSLGRDSWANKFLLRAIVHNKQISIKDDEFFVPIDELDYCLLQYIKTIKQYRWKLWKESLTALMSGKERAEILDKIRALALSLSL